MFHCLDHADCEKFVSPGDKKKCMWPLNHADKKSFQKEGTIRDLPILDKQGIQAAGLGLLTRRQAGQDIVRAEENTIEKTDKKLQSLVKELSTGLSKDVYSEEGVAVIEHTRIILTLPALALKLKAPGASAIKVAVTGELHEQKDVQGGRRQLHATRLTDGHP
jgi:hypothetical protein